MRSIAAALGVQCQFCHVGEPNAQLSQIDFASEQKRNKIVARHMLRMVQEINGRIDTIPARGTPRVVVTCNRRFSSRAPASTTTPSLCCA